MKIKVLSSLEKVFKNKEPDATERNSYTMLKNDRLSFQVAFSADVDGNYKIELSGIDNNYINVFSVHDVPVGLAAFEDSDDFYLSKESGMYPDILYPSDETEVKAGEWHSFWIEIIPSEMISGKQKLDISVGGETVSVEVQIIDVELPEQELVFTNWFHCDSICDYYHVEAFDDEFWRIFKNFLNAATSHGMNCILTPLFTPALDTKPGGERTTTQLVKIKKRGGKYSFNFSLLQKWVDVCRENGIKYFEMCHFFTQWGAEHAPKIMAKDRKGREKRIFGWETKSASKEYDDFLSQFSVKLNKFIVKNNLEKSVFFHISDEPSENHIKAYKRRTKLMKEIFGAYPVIDALHDIQFYENGSVDIPIPEENSIDNFYGKCDPLWTYYCCGQGNKYAPNRFISMPSQRNRVLGTILYHYDVKGFLQWGFNFYNTRLSIKNINPYEVTDAGGFFPSGDSFVVYPSDNGDAICSLRLKVFYDGFRDYTALKLLESKIGRDKVLEIVGDINMNNYPHNAEWLLDLREKVNSLL